MSAQTWRGRGLLGGATSTFTSLLAFLARLMEHEDDPDVDEPLATPLGHILGKEPTSSEQGGPEGPYPGDTAWLFRRARGGWTGDNTNCLSVGHGSAAAEGKPILSEEERQEQTKRYGKGETDVSEGRLPPVPNSPVSSKNLELSTVPLGIFLFAFFASVLGRMFLDLFF